MKTIQIKDNYSPSKIKEMTEMSNILRQHIVTQKLYTNIKGKNYAHVEGWQFAGGLMGLFPKISKVENLSSDKEYKWKADVDIVDMKTGQIISNGFALCSNKESIKKNFDEYAVLSMAQTRAIGKAYRNLIGWVMKLAGYEGTPSEEMRKVDEIVKEPQEKTTRTENIDNIEDHVCVARGCGRDLTKQEAEFSKKMFKKEFCREHQKEANNNK